METREDIKENDSQDEGSDQLDIEPLLQALGGKGVGPYQIRQMVFHLVSIFCAAISVMSVVFIGYKPAYHCAEVNTTTLESLLGLNESWESEVEVTYGQCSIDVETNATGQIQRFSLSCVQGFHYEGGKDTSFFTEWDLTCEKSALTELTQTLMMVGQAIGAFSLTSLADRLGRKPLFLTCAILRLVVEGVTALSHNYYFFLVCRVLIGVIQQGSMLVGFTMMVELLPRRLRGAAGMMNGGVLSAAVMVLPGLAFLLQHYSWRYLQILLAALSSYTLVQPWLVDESLRWLVANKKKKEAELVLKKACRLNGVHYHKVHVILEAMLDNRPIIGLDTKPSPNENTQTLLYTDVMKQVANRESENTELSAMGEPMNEQTEGNEPMKGEVSTSCSMKEGGDGVKKYTVLDVLRTRVLFKTTFSITFMWVADSLTYYGLMLTSASLAGNRFLSFFLQAAMELPASLTAFFCLRRFGRRTVVCAFLLLTSTSLILSSTLLATVSSPVIGPVTNVLSMLGKFGVSGAFSASYVYCPELFPTNLRTAGMGTAASIARFGGMVAPYASNLAAIALWAPGYILGGVAAVATYLISRLPETRGLPMPTTIEDMETRYRSRAKHSTKSKGLD